MVISGVRHLIGGDFFLVGMEEWAESASLDSPP